MKRIKLWIISLMSCSLLISGCGARQSSEYATLSPDIADTFPLTAEAVDSNPQLSSTTGPYAIFHTTAGDIVTVLYPEQAPKAVENFTTLAKNGYYNGSIFYWIVKNSIVQAGSQKAAEEESESAGEETSTQDSLVEQALTSEDEASGKSIWGGEFEDEFDDGLHNFHGALCMANSGYDSNSTEFYFLQNNEIPSVDDVIVNLYVNQYLVDKNNELGQKMIESETGLSDEEITAFEDEVNNTIKSVVENIPDEAREKYQDIAQRYQEVGGSPGLDYKHTVFGQVVYGQNIVDAISQVKLDAYKKPKQDVIINSIEILDTKPDYVTIN